VAINPSRQFKLARDSQRLSNITAILNAVGQNMAEHKGVFYCDSSPLSIPLVATVIAKDSLASELDIAHCIIPNYISSMPFDPIKSDSYFTDITKYNTGYKILQDSSGRITVSADGEITNPISITR
jgi:hypothetical protein